MISGGYMNARWPFPSLNLRGLQDSLAHVGDKVKAGAGDILASQPAAEGWKDVFDGVRSSLGKGAALGSTAAIAQPAGALASTAGRTARAVGAVVADSGRAAASLATVGDAGAAALAGPSEINIALKFANPATAREVTSIQVIREPLAGVTRSASEVAGVAGKVAKAPRVMPAVPAEVPVKPNGLGGLPGAGSEGGTLVKSGLAKIGSGMLSGLKSGALFSGVISGVVNGFQVLTGHERFGEGMGNVAADTADGAVSGAVGAAASGLAIAAAGALGMTVGLPLTLLGVAGGLGGALIGHAVFKGTGLYDGIRGLVRTILGG